MPSKALHSSDAALDSTRCDHEDPHWKNEELWTIDSDQFGSGESEDAETLTE